MKIKSFFKGFILINMVILGTTIGSKNQACAEIVVIPVSLTLKASMPSSPPEKLIFIGTGLANAVMYKILPAQGPNGVLQPDKFKIKTPYTIDFQPLDQFQTILSKNTEGQSETWISVDVDWKNTPGVYSTRLISNSGEREVPVQVNVLPKTIVSLNPPKFDLMPSNMEAPLVTKIQVFLASNSVQWHLYCISNSLTRKGGKEQIKESRVYVRSLSSNDSLPWHRLDKPFRVASGGPGPNRKIATIELAFESQRQDLPGRYEGNFRFMISNTQ